MTHHPTDPGLIAQGGGEAAGTDILDRARAALEGVTPGPWRWDGDTFADVKPYVCPHGTEWIDHGPDLVVGSVDRTYPQQGLRLTPEEVITSSGYDSSSLEIRAADAEFIAAARTLVPELLAEVERLRGALERIKPNARYISECGEPAGDEIMEEIEAVLRGDQ